MFGYLCLFFTVFFAGAPAFVMVILAYARRREADPITRTHLQFQIRTFWWCFWLTILAVAALVAALVIGMAGALGSPAPADAPGLETISNTQPLAMPSEGAWEELIDGAGRLTDGLQAAPTALVLLGISGVLSVVSVLWTFLASLWGGLKLAVGLPIGRI
jgi:hypothetical protein